MDFERWDSFNSIRMLLSFDLDCGCLFAIQKKYIYQALIFHIFKLNTLFFNETFIF